MKKITNMFSKKALLSMAVVSGIFIVGCNNSDYNKKGETTQMGEKDTMMVNHDTAINNSNMEMRKDTATTLSNTAGKVPMADPAGVKTVKRGKVSIVMAEAVPDKNIAMEKDKEGYYKNTEVLPAFPGGQKALERFFENNVQYPEQATQNDVQGVVKLIFSVDENGKIYQPVTVGDKVGYGIEEEAIRVFNKMPAWTPGKIKGKNVKTRFTLPIRFQLY